MQLAHILTQVQNDNYQVDYDRSSFGFRYAHIVSRHKGLVIKMDIGKRRTDSISWTAEIGGVVVGSGAVAGIIEVENILGIIGKMVEGSTEELQLKLSEQF